MESNLKLAFAFVMKDEGGYTDEKEDTGGATKYGITIHDLAKWRSEKWSKSTTKKDVMLLTPEIAQAIYKEWYWDKVRADELPDGVDYMVFDCAILHGANRAARYLQLALGVKVDDIIGPKTLEAAHTAEPSVVIEKIEHLRRQRARSRPNWKTYGTGWTNRINRVTKRAKEMLND